MLRFIFVSGKADDNLSDYIDEMKQNVGYEDTAAIIRKRILDKVLDILVKSLR